jgi:hypothetical protein
LRENERAYHCQEIPGLFRWHLQRERGKRYSDFILKSFKKIGKEGVRIEGVRFEGGRFEGGRGRSDVFE